MAASLIRLYILVALGLGTAVEGYAPHYAKGLMAKVAARRGIEAVPCMISSAQYPIGTWLVIYGKNTGALRWCKVVDVSKPEHKAGHIKRKRYIELAWEMVESICGNWGRSADCPVIVFYLEEQ